MISKDFNVNLVKLTLIYTAIAAALSGVTAYIILPMQWLTLLSLLAQMGALLCLLSPFIVRMKPLPKETLGGVLIGGAFLYFMATAIYLSVVWFWDGADIPTVPIEGEGSLPEATSSEKKPELAWLINIALATVCTAYAEHAKCLGPGWNYWRKKMGFPVKEGT